MGQKELSSSEIASIERVLLKAYGLNAFKMMTYQRMGIRLEEEVNLNQGFKYIVHDFVDLAVRGDWLSQLIRSAVAGQTGSYDLFSTAKSLNLLAPPEPIVPGSGPVTAANPDLEKLVRSRSTLLNFQAFLDGCTRLTRQLCTIEIPRGNPMGTGWLVAADLLLTNYHVVDALDFNTALPQDVVCVFDRLYEGAALTTCGLADSWRVSYSRTAGEDIALNAPAAPPDELDYALIRLARTVGKETFMASGETRGWITLEANPPAVVEKDVVLIVQHPGGRSLEAAFGNVVDYNSAGTRIRYDANTEGGSSGSPCLTVDLKPIALHNVGGVGDARKYNQGIPLRRIIEDLKGKNFLHLVLSDSQ